MMFKPKSIYYVAPNSHGNYSYISSTYYKELQVENTDNIVLRNL